MERLHTVAVIGAGSRGRSFARRCARAGFAVVLEDVLSVNLRRAAEVFAAEPEPLRQHVRLVDTVEDAVRTADVAIDFVPDELESKLEIFSMMDRMAPPRTVFCTPTTLSITDLASCTYRAGLCVGLAPFGEEVGAVVRVVRGAASTEETVQRVTDWLAALGVSVEVGLEGVASEAGVAVRA